MLVPSRQVPGDVFLELVALGDDGRLRAWAWAARRDAPRRTRSRQSACRPATRRNPRRPPESPSACAPRRPSAGIIHTCVVASSPPRSARNAIVRPSGDHWRTLLAGVGRAGQLLRCAAVVTRRARGRIRPRRSAGSSSRPCRRSTSPSAENSGSVTSASRARSSGPKRSPAARPEHRPGHTRRAAHSRSRFIGPAPARAAYPRARLLQVGERRALLRSSL